MIVYLFELAVIGRQIEIPALCLKVNLFKCMTVIISFSASGVSQQGPCANGTVNHLYLRNK